MSVVLSVEGLGIGFPRHRAVHDLALTVAAGETVALVGESGCGKSATALSLMRLLPPEAEVRASHMRLGEVDLLAAAPRALRALRGKRIAMVFQEPMTSLNPVMTVGRQIAEVLRLHENMSRAAARRRAVELLSLVRIAEAHRCCDEYPHRLSGGMRQRVMIAMAVACTPQLLIADEPTTALDVTIQSQVLELLDTLRRQLGMGLLLITHDLGVVAQWADRVVAMYAGRVVEEGTAARFFAGAGPLHPYARGLLNSTIRADGDAHYRTSRLQEIRGSIESAQGEPGCAFAPRCPAVQPACRLAVPALRASGPAHRVACDLVAASHD
ncbi:MAG: dipeptide/oligopeptide/nickel ABC transporter ATP-binding protein [Pseudomonadota bacterium]|nr:ABC transporter ATP-binding protein [Rubrivivax sp.]